MQQSFIHNFRMKKPLLLLFILLSTFLKSEAQVTETFESATVNSNSFTNGTFTGNLTPTGTSGFIVQTLSGYGYNSSTKFLEYSSANACSITSNFKGGC